MSDGPIPYGIKAPGFDPTAGFRRELQKVEARRAQKESRALEMASMIEMADQSTMFGGDYSIANQWAEHLTENLDKYASSTEGMIKFQQQAQRLTKFIDGAEAYKKENFGSVKDGAQAGTFQGFVQRQALGENVYGDFEDGRDPQSYEMAYMGLNQPIQLNWDADDNPIFMDNGKPMSFDQYRRPDAPFMPKLKEGKILMGSTWYAAEGPNKSHETSTEAYEYSLAMTETDPRLERQAARLYQLNEKPNMKVDDIVSNPALMKEAREAWAKDAEKSWIDLQAQKTQAKPTAKQMNMMQNLDSLFQSEFPIAQEGPVMPGEELEGERGFSPTAITGKLDLSDLVSDRLKKKMIKNPEYEDEYSDVPEMISVDTPVLATPSNVSVLPDGRIRLSALGRGPSGEEIPDIIVDESTNEGRAVMSQLDALFREAYPIGLRDYINDYRLRTGAPETVVSGGNPLNLDL